MTELRNLQDNPRAWWDTDLVAKVVEEYVKRWGIEVIITFDDGGVSGHINHRAVGAGVRLYPLVHGTNIRHLVLSSEPIPAYQLTSIFVLRKYTILLDLPVILVTAIPRFLWTTIFGDPQGHWGLMVASPSMYFRARKAFESHASQVVWDRYFASNHR